MNSVAVVSCLFALAAVVSANPPLAYSYLAPLAAVDSIPNPNYGFNYAVNDPLTGDNKGQWEIREGDVVKGAYSLVEPDGNIRVVEYRADPLTGFNAVVKRTGPNVHSVALPAPAPVIVSKPIVAPAPIIETPIIEAPIIEHAPLIAPAPVIAPIAAIDYLPYLPLPNPAPWVHLQGSSYGPKGNIVRRWAAGPISLDGKRITIRTKH